MESSLAEASESTPLLIRGLSAGKPNDQLLPASTGCTDAAVVYDANSHAGFADGRYGEDRISLVIQPLDNDVHCHSRSRADDASTRSARRKLIAVSVLCFIFMIGEVVGGVLANSLAIATDAAHLLSDLAGFLISLFAIYIASRPATKRMSFGWYRAEVMGAMVSVLIIWIVTAVLVFMAIQRVLNQDYDIDATVMLIMAFVSIVFNVIMLLVLCIDPHAHGHSHGLGGSHSHGHGHNKPQQNGHAHHNNHGAVATDAAVPNGALPTEDAAPATTTMATAGEDGVADVERKQNANINVRAAFIHALGDLFQSVGVFVAAMVIFFVPEAKIADPICTFVFSVLVMITTFSILKDALSVLMEAAPKDLSFNEVRDELCSIDGVTEVHDLRLWSLTTNKPALAVHLAIDSAVDTEQVLSIARTVVQQKFSIYECTFQVERYVAEMNDCTKCQDPKD